MRCFLTVNIKDAKTHEGVKNLVKDKLCYCNAYQALQIGIDDIKKYLNCNIRQHEIHSVKNNNISKMGYRITPAKLPLYGTVTIYAYGN